MKEKEWTLKRGGDGPFSVAEGGKVVARRRFWGRRRRAGYHQGFGYEMDLGWEGKAGIFFGVGRYSINDSGCGVILEEDAFRAMLWSVDILVRCGR
ncbi:MAG: hypothetical protein ACJAQT_001932 [Akkermansiaceae bacterium]|jgi:hypothetical protein